MESPETEREKLIEENDEYFSLNREIPLPGNAAIPGTIITAATSEPDAKVSPVHNKSIYYTINITATGWYNIDILMKDYSNCAPSELMVRMQGNYKVDFNVTLIIPFVKAFIEGGKLNNGIDYGFDEGNGHIPLPQNTKAIILAFAEYEGGIIFGKGIFNTQTRQVIDITIAETTKEKFKIEIKNLGLDNVNMELKDSKNAERIRQTDKAIKELEKLKPQNCDCDLPVAQTGPHGGLPYNVNGNAADYNP